MASDHDPGDEHWVQLELPFDLSDVQEEADLAAARREWRTRYRARARVMETLLANATDDNVPTPRGDGDD